MIAVIDFETTGFPRKGVDCHRQPGITQIGLIILNEQSLEEEYSYSTYIDPEKDPVDWSQKAIDVTGIGPEEVKDSPTFFAAFHEFAKQVTGCTTYVGYNNPFDKEILFHQLERYGFLWSFPWPPNDIDMMRVGTQHFNERGPRGAKRFKLTDLYRRVFGKEFEGAHDALGDCRATARLLREIGTGHLEAIYGKETH